LDLLGDLRLGLVTGGRRVQQLPATTAAELAVLAFVDLTIWRAIGVERRRDRLIELLLVAQRRVARDHDCLAFGARPRSPPRTRPIARYSPRAARRRWLASMMRPSSAARNAAAKAALRMLAPVMSSNSAASSSRSTSLASGAPV